MAGRAAPVLGVRDVPAAVEHYQSAFGFECPGGMFGPEDERVYAVMRRDGIEVHLQIRRRNIWAAARGSHERSAYLYCPDVDSLHGDFDSAGALVIEPPTDMPYGNREIVLRDQDGHRLAFGVDSDRTDSAWETAPVLGCRDVEVAMSWFVDTLGFSCPGGLFTPPDHEPVYAIVFREGAGIHLQIRRRPVFLAERQAHEGDAYLFVDDPDALHEEYAAKGVTVIRPPQDEPYGLRDFTIETPTGHRLTFARDT